MHDTETQQAGPSSSTINDNELAPPRFHFVASMSFVITLVGLLVVSGRVLALQLFPSASLEMCAPITETARREYAIRGDIRDRRNRVLATTRLGYRLFADPAILDDPFTAAAELSRRLNVDLIELDQRLQARLDSRYVPLIPLLSDSQWSNLRGGPAIRGLGVETVAVRERPYGDLASALVGKVGADDTGLSGAEFVFGSALSGKAGRTTYLRDVQRRAMWIEPAGFVPPTDGEPIRLSIDIEIQQIAEEELAGAVEQYNAGGGRLVVIDPRTGEILAMCDQLRDKPGFGPIAKDEIRATDPSLARVRCATDPFEPGSTFKPYVWATALEAGVTKPDEVFNTHNGAFRTSKGRLIRDSHGYDELDWDRVLVKSSNIGMAQAAERLSFDELRDAVRRFGFGLKTNCGVPGESAGIVTPRANWNHYTQTSVSFGQEIAVTPLQHVRAFSAFAGDGRIPTLTLLAVNGTTADARRSDGRSAYLDCEGISESIAYQTRCVLRRVFTEGSGRLAENDARYEMFGKSGTPQLPDRVNGGYHQDRYMSNFIAGAPFDDPLIVVLCVIEDPDRSINHWGGAIAGPVVRNVVNRTLEYMGVSPMKSDN